jgi:hypothetical protein
LKAEVMPEKVIQAAKIGPIWKITVNPNMEAF